MPTDVDIIVTDPDTPEVRLIVEARLSVSDIRSTEKLIKQAMLRMSSPVGLLITPEKLWVYLDRYLSQGPDSVENVGEFEISTWLKFKPQGKSKDEALHFERTVQQWLEDLPQDAAKIRRKLHAFDNAVLAAILTRAEEIKSDDKNCELFFCTVDEDLQPWDKNGNAKPVLQRLYDEARVWVYGEFGMTSRERPDDWPR